MRKLLPALCLGALSLSHAASAQTVTSVGVATTGAAAGASTDAAELAKQLSNPVASLIAVPFQYNYNEGFGADGDGSQSYVNIQPVIPISIGANWNVISRTIVPVVWQDGIVPDEGSQFGLGNTLQSLFLSPKQPTASGLIWGVGPAIQFPTATDGISPNQWGLGVTAVGLKQKDGWTFGALANQVWTVTGNSRYGEQSNAFLQPFLSYTTPKATSFTLNSESAYDWNTEEWSVPINFMVGQIVKIGKQPVQFTVGARYWADAPEFGPEGWGGRFQVALLFPK